MPTTTARVRPDYDCNGEPYYGGPTYIREETLLPPSSALANHVAYSLDASKFTQPPAFRWLEPGDAGYTQALSQAFPFLRRNADGRYSDTTLMKLTRAVDNIDGAGDLPTIVIAEMPYSYDELTEVKSGGIAAMAVTYQSGKTLLAVHRNLRRRGLGRCMTSMVGGYSPTAPHYWVGGSNAVGQQFLVASGLRPTAINSRGAVRYGTDYGDEEDARQLLAHSTSASGVTTCSRIRCATRCPTCTRLTPPRTQRSSASSSCRAPC